MNLPRHHLLGRLLALVHSGRARLGNFKRGGHTKRPAPRRRRPAPRGSHVLDVLVKSSRQERIERARRWRRGLQWSALLAALTILAATSHQAIARYFWQNPEFHLARSAEIRTNGTLTHDDILRRAGLHDTTHIYAVDLRATREKLEALPNVRHATVQRELPGRLIIEVEERLPAMWLSCDQPSLQPFTANPRQGACLLDEEGHLFLCQALRTELMQLPVLHVRRLANSQPGAHLNTPTVQTGLHLLQRLRDTFGPRGLDVVEIDAPNDWSLVAKLSNDLSVTFGYDDLDGQMDRLARVVDLSADRQLRLGTVNLLPKKNVPVTFLTENHPEPAANADGTGAADGLTPPPTGAPVPVSGRPQPPARRDRSLAREAEQLEAILGGGR